MADFNRYVDPIFLSKITYSDKDGKLRVKNPYRNRHSYCVIIPSVNASGDFVWVVPEDITGKSVFVNFPAKVMYSFTVNALTKEVTVKGIPAFTYIEINVVNPKPLPPSDRDLLWDELDYDAQKSIVAAWGDIDLICNVLYPASAESELGFDDQNTIKYGLVGWKNNCGNDKNTDWKRPVVPPNGVYYPPQPIPVPPPPPIPPPTDVGHDYDYKFVLRWEDGSRTDLDFYGFLDHKSSVRVSYTNKEYGSGDNKMWLDRDYVSHESNGYDSQPEIITVLGFQSSTVSIQVSNYNGGALTKDFVVEVVRADQSIVKTYTVPSYHLSGNRNAVWVCDFNLATGTLTDKLKVVSLGTFN